jgi:transcriptional regulator with XRE-family HTH domain
MTTETPSDVAAARIRALRRQRDWQAIDLAVACAKAGHGELTENVIENIEHGRRKSDGTRRRAVTVDELLALAEVLSVSPAELLPGMEAQAGFGPLTLQQMKDVGLALTAFVSLQEQIASEHGDGA